MTQADQPAKPDARQPAGTNREALTRHLPRNATGYMSNPGAESERMIQAGMASQMSVQIVQFWSLD